VACSLGLGLGLWLGFGLGLGVGARGAAWSSVGARAERLLLLLLRLCLTRGCEHHVEEQQRERAQRHVGQRAAPEDQREHERAQRESGQVRHRAGGEEGDGRDSGRRLAPEGTRIESERSHSRQCCAASSRNKNQMLGAVSARCGGEARAQRGCISQSFIIGPIWDQMNVMTQMNADCEWE
jgi:hypothetical protein